MDLEPPPFEFLKDQNEETETYPMKLSFCREKLKQGVWKPEADSVFRLGTGSGPRLFRPQVLDVLIESPLPQTELVLTPGVNHTTGLQII